MDPSKRDAKPSRRKGPSAQERRREEVLRAQKESRRSALYRARDLIEDGDQREDRCGDENEKSASYHLSGSSGGQFGGSAESASKGWRQVKRSNRVLERRIFWASSVTTPEWMTDVPVGLNGTGSSNGEGWYVRPRPEGRRCLVTAYNGVTVARALDGNVLHRWASPLPCGGSSSRGLGKGAFIVLDCIFDDAQTFWILDAMHWREVDLYENPTEFRLFWLTTKITEEAPDMSTADPFRLALVPFYECNPAGLEQAYQGPVPFARDGLLFYLKQGFYRPGSSPLVLQWKDAVSSQYLVYSKTLQAVLEVRQRGAEAAENEEEDEDLAAAMGAHTLEHPLGLVNAWGPPKTVMAGAAAEEAPAAPPAHDLCLVTLEGLEVGSVPEALVVQKGIKPGELLKFSALSAHEDETGNPVLVDAQFLQRCSPSRALADSWSKILFQSRARSSPEPRIEEILASAHVPLVQAPALPESLAPSVAPPLPPELAEPTMDE